MKTTRLLLAETIRVAKDGKAITEKEMSRMAVDSTGREKNTSSPTDTDLSGDQVIGQPGTTCRDRRQHKINLRKILDTIE